MRRAVLAILLAADVGHSSQTASAVYLGLGYLFRREHSR